MKIPIFGSGPNKGVNILCGLKLNERENTQVQPEIEEGKGEYTYPLSEYITSH